MASVVYEYYDIIFKKKLCNKIDIELQDHGDLDWSGKSKQIGRDSAYKWRSWISVLALSSLEASTKRGQVGS